MNTIASPPVPKNLRDLLAAYPAYLTKLEWLLDHTVSHPSAGVPVFEQALWAIEEGLSSFVGDAQAELDAARASGDAAHMTYADEKLKLLQRATFKQVWVGDEELWAYFHGASDKDIL
jgi:hypothetical protein